MYFLRRTSLFTVATKTISPASGVSSGSIMTSSPCLNSGIMLKSIILNPNESVEISAEEISQSEISNSPVWLFSLSQLNACMASSKGIRINPSGNGGSDTWVSSTNKSAGLHRNAFAYNSILSSGIPCFPFSTRDKLPASEFTSSASSS